MLNAHIDPLGQDFAPIEDTSKHEPLIKHHYNKYSEHVKIISTEDPVPSNEQNEL